MIYGRRIISSNHYSLTATSATPAVSRAFQAKYALYMLTAVGFGSLLFFAPAIYFIHQNYELFKNLAFTTSPNLVSHLERETTWLYFFLGSSFIAICAASAFFSYRMTQNLLVPLVAMERHMTQVTLGHWSGQEFKAQHKNDFKELSTTYDYLYRSLRINAENEIRALEKLRIDPQSRDTFYIWKNLIQEKKLRLGMKEEKSSENVVELTEFDRKHRAS